MLHNRVEFGLQTKQEMLVCVDVLKFDGVNACFRILRSRGAPMAMKGMEFGSESNTTGI